VRCREISRQEVEPGELTLHDLVYPAGGAEEHFISYDTPNDHLAGFLRLSLPGHGSPPTGIDDLEGAAIIREVHVYGQSLEVGSLRRGAAQHAGLGTQLIAKAEEIAREKGFTRMAVISAIGTRLYYLNRGFERGELYLHKSLKV
jgi:elongator complex protein 3